MKNLIIKFCLWILAKLDVSVTVNPPPIEPPDPFPFWWGWWEKPMNEWPAFIGSAKVAYIKIEDKQPLRYIAGYNEAGKPIYEIAEIDGKRVIAKADKWLMVYPPGDYYGLENDRVRPFEGNSGVMCFHIMYENFVDNERLDEYPLRPLFWEVKGNFIIFEPNYEVDYPGL